MINIEIKRNLIYVLMDPLRLETMILVKIIIFQLYEIFPFFFIDFLKDGINFL